MTDDEIIAVLRLQTVPNIGNVTAKKLIAHCGSPTAIFEDKMQHLLKIESVGQATIKGLFDTVHLEEAEAEYDYIKKEHVGICYFMDKNYPEYLKHCFDGPIVLFKRGNIDLEHRKIISVVGTRNVTSYGTAFCEEFIEEIAPLNPVIVSGFAYGVDITVQKAAMEKGLQTIGCLAHGLNQIYPKKHKNYVSGIEKNGGFITEFWSTSNPDRENFLKRNRIIAGMSEATIVVESAEKGGSLVTADLANGYNREVFGVPGRYKDKFSKGCNDLIKKQKAHMLTSAAELIYLLGWKLEKQQPVLQKQLFVELDETEQKVCSYLQTHGKQLLDTIALECGIPVHKTSSILFNMEMKSVIRALPGKLFEVV
ncbi:DNA-processing protein DprA [Flagellimonas sp. HMM57]|uniref:DNA-processing protein DprA n=1 Tax=unclassified Flagellimonas TaxID=2644544 RepID=UPI0013D22208|nr:MULTISPECIES: DNA-processing protein DprA [unclassified Flagellimonas]UII77542.1 DNA-processing protein DprA [Flagellimonas sp. HMM57]